MYTYLYRHIDIHDINITSLHVSGVGVARVALHAVQDRVLHLRADTVVQDSAMNHTLYRYCPCSLSSPKQNTGFQTATKP